MIYIRNVTFVIGFEPKLIVDEEARKGMERIG